MGRAPLRTALRAPFPVTSARPPGAAPGNDGGSHSRRHPAARRFGQTTDRRVLAASQDGVYESTDGGKSFTKRLAVASGDAH